MLLFLRIRQSKNNRAGIIFSGLKIDVTVINKEYPKGPPVLYIILVVRTK